MPIRLSRAGHNGLETFPPRSTSRPAVSHRIPAPAIRNDRSGRTRLAVPASQFPAGAPAGRTRTPQAAAGLLPALSSQSRIFRAAFKARSRNTPRSRTSTRVQPKQARRLPSQGQPVWLRGNQRSALRNGPPAQAALYSDCRMNPATSGAAAVRPCSGLRAPKPDASGRSFRFRPVETAAPQGGKPPRHWFHDHLPAPRLCLRSLQTRRNRPRRSARNEKRGPQRRNLGWGLGDLISHGLGLSPVFG